MVAKFHINLTEVFFPLELIKEIVDSGNHVPVPEREFFWGLVIIIESLGLVFLLHRHDWASKGDEC
jgi:hypothetical protein